MSLPSQQPRVVAPPDGPGRLTAVCVVHAIIPNPGEEPDVTAIDKRPRAGRLAVGAEGFVLDTQLDRRFHGGDQQALYAYADEDASWWATELGREIAPGLFGENLRTSGIDVTGARIGERWRVGEGNDAVELEVTMPRTPCMTFQKRMGLERWVKRFTRAGMPGAYLAVLTPGRTLAAGDPVTVTWAPGHGVTVADLLSGRLEGYAALLEAEEQGELELRPKVRAHARRRVGAARARGRGEDAQRTA
jgi:MOSC domain-containing protein YiiM